MATSDRVCTCGAVESNRQHQKWCDIRVDDDMDSERYVLIAGGDGYHTVFANGRRQMEEAFFRMHWPELDPKSPDLDEDQARTLALVKDEDEWAVEPSLGRVYLHVAYEADWVYVFRLTDSAPGSATISVPTAE